MRAEHHSQRRKGARFRLARLMRDMRSINSLVTLPIHFYYFAVFNFALVRIYLTINGI